MDLRAADGQRSGSLIRARFGPSSTAVDARLEAASHDELDRWAVQLLTAATLDDVFREQ